MKEVFVAGQCFVIRDVGIKENINYHISIVQNFRCTAGHYLSGREM
jgi:hypothetical protein